MPFQNDGSWRPNLKQEKFLAIPDSIKEAAYLGGAGSGKTELLLMLPIIRGWYKNSKFKQVFLRRTFPELRNEVVPRSKEFYTRFGASFNKTEMIWTFPSGAIVLLGHCEHEDDVHQYDSMEINLFTPDEVTSLTEYIYLYLSLTRVRSSDKELPSITRATGMPGGIGHTFIKKRFVDPEPHGGKIVKGKGGRSRIFIHATQADNPYIDPTYKTSLEALPDAEKQAKLYGSFDAYLGQVFDEFRDHKHPDEPLNALHVIEPFDIPKYWPKLLVGDWGYSAYTWIGYGAVSPNKQLFIYREQVWRRTKIEEWAPYVREFIESESPRVVKFCRSARQNRGQEHTIEQQITEALGCPIELSDNNKGSRIAGKQLLHEYLRWKPKHVPTKDKPKYDDNYASWLLRNRGMKEYESYLSTFIDKEPELIPKLQIFDSCKFLVNAIKACTYDKTNIEDVAEFEGDDAYDGIRYMVDTADRFFETAVDEYNLIKKREELQTKFNNEQDMTAFYNQARLIDAINSGPQPIKRFRHR